MDGCTITDDRQDDECNWDSIVSYYQFHPKTEVFFNRSGKLLEWITQLH